MIRVLIGTAITFALFLITRNKWSIEKNWTQRILLVITILCAIGTILCFIDTYWNLIGDKSGLTTILEE
jgi:hypothetical protein